MIIGLTGPMGSGKTTVINTIKNKGYKHITLSSMLREECRKRGLEEIRENLMEIGQELREKYGAGILAERALEKVGLEGGNDWIIDGIRNPAEINKLRKHHNFVLVANTAPEDLIIKRILSRKRSDDTLTEESIRKKLRREWGEGEPEEGQQLGKCIAMADYRFENTMPMDEVEESFKEVLNKIEIK